MLTPLATTSWNGENTASAEVTSKAVWPLRKGWHRNTRRLTRIWNSHYKTKTTRSAQILGINGGQATFKHKERLRQNGTTLRCLMFNGGRPSVHDCPWGHMQRQLSRVVYPRVAIHIIVVDNSPLTDLQWNIYIFNSDIVPTLVLFSLSLWRCALYMLDRHLHLCDRLSSLFIYHVVPFRI